MSSVTVEHGVEKSATTDRGDGFVEATRFLRIRVHRVTVLRRRLAVGGQRGIGIGDCQQRLLHGRVDDRTLAQLQPRHQCPLRPRRIGFRPAEPEQRAVGERSVEPHPAEHGRGRVRLPLLQQGETERQVCAVTQRQLLLAACVDRADGFEQLPATRRVAGAHQRHAQVEARVVGPAVRVGPALERRRRLGKPPLGHQHVRSEQVPLGLEGRRQRAANVREVARRSVEIAALVADAGEVEVRAVADRLRHRPGEQLLESPRRLGVHAQRQVQAPGEQLCVERVVLEPPELARDFEPHQCVEIVVLEEVEQHVAVVQVADLGRRRQVGRGRTGPGHRDAGARGDQHPGKQRPRLANARSGHVRDGRPIPTAARRTRAAARRRGP